MWNSTTPVIILSMVAFLLGPSLSISFPKEMNRGGHDYRSAKLPEVYRAIGKPIGGGNDNEEDPNGTAVPPHPSRKKALSEEDALYDRVGREMHLLGDVMPSSPDSSSLIPVSDELSGE